MLGLEFLFYSPFHSKLLNVAAIYMMGKFECNTVVHQPHHLFVFNRQSWIRWNSYHNSSNDVLCTKITSQTRSPTITSLIWDTFFSNKQTKLLEIDPVVLEKKIFLNVINVFSLFSFYHSLESALSPPFEQIETPLPKDALCQKLAQWFWRRRFLNVILSLFEIIWIPFP